MWGSANSIGKRGRPNALCHRILTSVLERWKSNVSSARYYLNHLFQTALLGAHCGKEGGAREAGIGRSRGGEVVVWNLEG